GRLWPACGVAILALSTLLSTRGHGQSVPGAVRIALGQFAPPPIERGISPLRTETPGSPELLRRRSVRAVDAIPDKTGAPGAPYVAGKVIVKFRESATTATRIESVRAASRSASLRQRPDYANFDIISIDPDEDAETAAQALAARPDVEYAQPAYRVHAKLVP